MNQTTQIFSEGESPTFKEEENSGGEIIFWIYK